MIRAASLTGFVQLISELGGDAAPLLDRYHFDPKLSEDPDAYVPFKSFAELLEKAALQFQCPDFGIRMVHWQGLHMLGPVAVTARNASDVLDAFQCMGKYLYVHSPALKLSLTGRNKTGDFCFNYRIEEPGVRQMAQAYELSMANGVKILKLLAGQNARPVRIYFMHAPMSSKATYTRAFGCPVDFEASHTGIELRKEDALRPLMGADAQSRLIAQRYLETFQPRSSRIDDRVVELIHGLLATGQCTIAMVAEQTAMHPRTLQRALFDAGTTYETLLDEVRRHKLSQYLAQTDMRFSQIAGLLGYTDQSTMNRACRRWFGCSPKDLRRSFNVTG